MTANDERRTIEETYARAQGSSHLEMSFERRGDVDVLIAAGWVNESLGTRLFRLRKGYLDVLPGLSMAQADRAKLLRQADEVDKQRDAWTPGMDDALLVKCITEAARLRSEAAAAMLTAHLMALIHLPGLDETKRDLATFASALATKRRFMMPDKIVMAIAGRALDSWLDPLCHHCTGRGFSGGYSAHRTLCKHCGGTGRRYPRLGKTDADHEFGRALLVEMDRKAEAVSRSMSRYLRA
jgi:hypothetical protein